MSKIIVALDNMTRFEAIKLASKLQSKVLGFKITDLLVSHGVGIIADLAPYGQVMADLKFFDIPTTVTNHIKQLISEPVSFITCHVTGGSKMLEAAIDASKGVAKIVAVTKLTSMSDEDVLATYGEAPMKIFSRIILDTNGVYGVVTPLKDLNFWSHIADVKTFVPGVRIAGKLDDNDDQVQLAQTADNDINYLIVGRPITKAADPVEATQQINDYFNFNIE